MAFFYLRRGFRHEKPDKDGNMPIEMIEAEEDGFSTGTNIKVIGVGGGGSNAVDHMIACNVQGIEFISANTDAQALSRATAAHTIQLGTSGLGAGSKPEKGREAAEAASDEIRQAIRGAHMLFITAGMGGGTGTGAAPIIARIAKDMGILTVGVVTRHFDWEGRRRMANAETGLRELEANVDSLLVVLNEKLLEVLGEDITQDEAFAQANDVLKNAVGGIAGIISEYGQVNVDFEDVRTVMSEPGKAIMGTASASGPDRARIAAEKAVACPLLEGIDLSGAKGVVVVITASRKSLKLSESRTAVETIRHYASSEAEIIYGSNYDDALGDEIRVTVIATGLSDPNAARQSMSVMRGGLRTGTDGGMLSTPAAGNGFQTSDFGHLGLSSSVFRASPARAGAAAAARPGTPPAARPASDALNKEDNLEIPAFLRRNAD